MKYFQLLQIKTLNLIFQRLLRSYQLYQNLWSGTEKKKKRKRKEKEKDEGKKRKNRKQFLFV